MPRGNVNNLIRPSPEEARKNGSKGGIISGKTRRDRKYIQEALQKALNGKYDFGEEEDKKKLGGYEALALSMIKEAINGNVQAFKEIRDTVGEKPKDTVGFESETLTGISIKFVDKSNKNIQKEKDPKIIGDYTPPSNIDEY